MMSLGQSGLKNISVESQANKREFRSTKGNNLQTKRVQ